MYVCMHACMYVYINDLLCGDYIYIYTYMNDVLCGDYIHILYLYIIIYIYMYILTTIA